MKVFLRVVVTILILTGLGFGIYFIFFKPAGDDVVFLKLSEVMEYKQQTGTDAISSNRVEDKINLINQQQTVVASINPIYDGEVCRTNSNLLYTSGSSFELNVNETTRVVISCKAMDDKLSAIFDYYFAYTQAGKNVSKNTQKDIAKAIKAYKTSYSELNIKLNSIISMQNSIINAGNANENFALELSNRYYNAVVSYRECLKNYSDLILKVKEFVIKYVFDSSIINDKDITTNDILLYSIKNAVNTDFGIIKDGVSDESRLNSINLLTDVCTFSQLDLDSIVMVKAGSVISESYVYVPKLVTVNESGDTALIITKGSTYYRQNNAGKWLVCSGPNYVIKDGETNELTSAVNVNVDSFYKVGSVTAVVGDESSEQAIQKLKASKLVESYTYIVNNGYLNELITILSHSRKSEFMSAPAGFSIVDICVPSIQYVLACYGFSR